jgi:hypothetical protein
MRYVGSPWTWQVGPLEDANVRAARQGSVDARGVGPQADSDYGAWSRHRGNPHAYPPICTGAISSVRSARGAQNGIFVALAIFWRMRAKFSSPEL